MDGKWSGRGPHSSPQAMKPIDKSTSITWLYLAVSLSPAVGGGRTMEVAVSFTIQDRISLKSYVPNTGEGVSPKLDSFLQPEAIL